VSSLQPSTTYSVTVTTRDAGGTSPASAPILFTTGPATTAPAAPVITHDWWAQPGLLAVSWQPGSTGDSPVDKYLVSITAPDAGGQSSTATVAPPSTSAYLSADSTLDWSITVRAHNAAGWSPWSTATVLSGL
jgi:hypothetical protein